MSRGHVLLQAVKAASNVHRPSNRPNVFIKTMPRSGSTWLMELILTQPGFKPCTEPLDLRNLDVRRHLPLADWAALYDDAALPVLERYFDGFRRGRLRFKNHSPRLAGYRPFTWRMVFKLLHGAEDRLTWLADRFNGRVVILLRHPIPVAISNRDLPRLDAFVNSAFARHFTDDQLAAARRIIAGDDRLHQGVLSWCLQTSVALRHRPADALVITYEQLVLQPAPVIHALAAHADLPRPARMLRRVAVPSATTDQSDKATRQVLAGKQDATSRRWLVEKWRERVGADDARRVMATLAVFGLDMYAADAVEPAAAYWLPEAAV